MKKIAKKLHALLLLVLVSFNLFGQQYWEFGRYRAFVHTATASAPLAVRMTGTAMLGELSFVSAVGGVAFHATATPGPSFYVSPYIRIDYMPYNHDGSRLRIVNGADTVFPYIADWQLLPILHYANNDYNSCVSLFGPKTDSNHFDIVYHPSFQNTLLGMRILQADMALMDTKTHWQLPTYQSRTVMGTGERMPREESCAPAAASIDRVLKKYNFASWVLTDDKISFSIRDNRIIFSGTPYYHFWITNIESDLVRYRKLYAKAYDDASAENKEAFEKDKTRLIALENKIKTEKESVIAVTAANDALKSNFDLLLKFNPAVYNAVLNTAHYAAFFRYMKENHPASWHTILNEISHAPVEPYVATPTSLPKQQLQQ